ncbi:MAG: Fic family protein [Gemmatimonadota bacterium]
MPLPLRLAAIRAKRGRAEIDNWLLLSPAYRPADSLGGHLEFALKYEGVDLAVLRRLFERVSADELADVARAKPTGAYARRIWFFYEWLTGRELPLPDSGDVKAVLAVDPEQQYAASSGAMSSRHRVRNNLPGDPAFCPLVRRTATLDAFMAMRLDERARTVIGRTHPDVVRRAAAFLLLSDSRASFEIEDERPSRDRAQRWAQVIAQAGAVPLTVEQLERLQRIVIGDDRFVRLGLRTEGGFIGDHDLRTHEPLPEHISAQSEDLRSLLDGMAVYAQRAVGTGVDPVVVAAAVAFGFVYVHPFEDGNGRLHRWLIHHVLAEAQYNPRELAFPVSAAILRQIHAYRLVLESYSRVLLRFIHWRPAPKGNVEVLNDTADYYRYFDATAHAEFLYGCVEETVETDLPDEVRFLEAFDEFVRGVNQIVDMPDRTIRLLHGFLRQNDGRLSKRGRTGEFARLTDAEVSAIEHLYADHFLEREEA